MTYLALSIYIKTQNFLILKSPRGNTKYRYIKFYFKKRPVILSTGMAKVKEIGRAIRVLNKKNITLLYCVSDYPTKIEDVNLKYMIKLKKIFKLPVGLSDHTSGILAPVIATSLGAKIIEKHVTLNKKLKGPDHKTSLTISDFKKMVTLIRETEKFWGTRKILSQGEISNLRAVRKSCVSKINIEKGQKFRKTHSF